MVAKLCRKLHATYASRRTRVAERVCSLFALILFSAGLPADPDRGLDRRRAEAVEAFAPALSARRRQCQPSLREGPHAVPVLALVAAQTASAEAPPMSLIIDNLLSAARTAEPATADMLRMAARAIETRDAEIRRLKAELAEARAAGGETS